MKSVLVKYGVSIPHELDAKFESNFKLRSASTAIEYKPNRNARLNDLVTLYNEISEFVFPILDSLDTLTFKTQRGCVIIEKCIDYFLKQMANSDCMPLPPDSDPNESLTIVNEKLVLLNSAVQKGEGLLYKILDGDATVKQILDIFTPPESKEEIIDETLLLEKPAFKQVLYTSILPVINELDLDKETQSLHAFIYLKKSECKCLKHVSDGITAIVEVFEACNEVVNLKKTCDQFSLHKCLNDPQMNQLDEITNEFDAKSSMAKLTMTDSIQKIMVVKKLLKIDTVLNNPCFKLISEVQKCGALYIFAQEKGFTSKDGMQNFLNQHRLVTRALQHEDYYDDVLDQLRGAMQFIFPFFDKECSLGELMEKITTLPKIMTGIAQLQVVNSNIDLIKLCFNRAEVPN